MPFKFVQLSILFIVMGKFLKKHIELINFLLIGVNIVFVLFVILFYYLKLDPTISGPIGDTFGGLFSPVIGLVSIYYIFKTFNEQRDQFLEEKTLLKNEYLAREQENLRLRSKEQVDRLTDISYRQLQRIDDNLRSHVFTIEGKSIEGRRGLYTLNTSLEQDFERINALNKVDRMWGEILSKLIASIQVNIDPLLDYFDHIFISLAVISKSIENANFTDSKDEKELLRLFILNLSGSFEETITRYRNILILIENESNITANADFSRLIDLTEDIFKMTIAAVEKVIKV